ncbi:hypothetical protein EW145_g5260 [Phellinidium pouzarii]|uniref:Peptidase M1 leukotriene A4 hydrolase/aminopeptidase C-terminal domain-containing protein n=1 Tax=Phellinidium pouzarii TaxID=167371 RepID=A0A4S4L0M3_9AGAM|nr:hypothetical protein EW145_g5260 [Phellinidium pouzarii]
MDFTHETIITPALSVPESHIPPYSPVVFEEPVKHSYPFDTDFSRDSARVRTVYNAYVEKTKEMNIDRSEYSGKRRAQRLNLKVDLNKARSLNWRSIQVRPPVVLTTSPTEPPRTPRRPATDFPSAETLYLKNMAEAQKRQNYFESYHWSVLAERERAISKWETVQTEELLYWQRKNQMSLERVFHNNLFGSPRRSSAVYSGWGVSNNANGAGSSYVRQDSPSIYHSSDASQNRVVVEMPISHIDGSQSVRPESLDSLDRSYSLAGLNQSYSSVGHDDPFVQGARLSRNSSMQGHIPATPLRMAPTPLRPRTDHHPIPYPSPQETRLSYNEPSNSVLPENLQNMPYAYTYSTDRETNMGLSSSQSLAPPTLDSNQNAFGSYESSTIKKRRADTDHYANPKSNYLAIATDHVAFYWNVDFDLHLISGSATHTLLVKDNVVKEVVFDSVDLDIASVEVSGKSVAFKLSDKHPVMGSALHVPFSKPISQGEKVEVKVFYKTSSEAIALQFLDKGQTQGKQFAFLFSQCQPIYARTLAPLQDTPSVKITYSAEVTSILPVLMSAVRVSPPSDGPAHDGKIIGKETVTYTYNQPTSIPSYLIAIACGNVRYKPFPKESGKDWSSGIWAEPELIDAAYWEFSADTNRFLSAEEKIVIPYKFGVYDLLVLPPSFPYGGMTLSCMNLHIPGSEMVSHASHFWLNEGWTSYIERILQEVLHSPAHRGFSFLIGYKALQDALKEYKDKPKYQRLIIDFEIGEDPDDAYSSVPYEKGANLILYLERILGGLDVFLPYVKDYVNTFMGKSINTDIWKDHLYTYWRNHGDESKIKALDSVDWDAWFYGEGLSLPVEMEYDITLAEQAYKLAERWDASRVKDVKSLGFKSTDLDHFDSNQKSVFLERLQLYSPLPPDHLAYLGDLYTISKTTNAEIRFRYYELALLDPSTVESKALASEAARWVVGDDGTGILKGRMKFCRPVLRAAHRADPEAAKRIFGAYKTSFHPIARRLIEKVNSAKQNCDGPNH